MFLQKLFIYVIIDTVKNEKKNYKLEKISSMNNSLYKNQSEFAIFF